MRRTRRGARGWRKPRLTLAMILGWADEYFQRQGKWPHHFSGRVAVGSEDTWSRVNDALSHGTRGLPGGSSLARELFIHRGVRSPRNVPPLNEDQIWAWARAHFERTGSWPSLTDGALHDAPDETWAAIDIALARGTRGLPGGSSIAQLLAVREAKRNEQQLPPYDEEQILAWADAFFRAHGHWPYRDSGPIDESPEDTWMSVHKALSRGRRGLQGGSSLASFLNDRRGIYGGKTRRSRRKVATKATGK